MLNAFFLYPVVALFYPAIRAGSSNTPRFFRLSAPDKYSSLLSHPEGRENNGGV